MLPRRHILDVWEFVKEEEQLLSMATVTLAVDAIKYLDGLPKKDHLIDALELNEFVCYMYPARRPENRSLLFHVVSDLLGLLLYGVPKKRRPAIEHLESINYSERNMDVVPIIGVWNALKAKVYTKKHGPRSIIDGFVKKIRVEMAVMDTYPFVEDVLCRSRDGLRKWLPSLARYYDTNGPAVKDIYDKWWALWLCGQRREKVLEHMVNRLCIQVERDFRIELDKGLIFASILDDAKGNLRENETFSGWYREGVDLLLAI